MQYFYDNQIRRYLAQVIRLFSDFSVKVGDSADGEPIYRTVPVNYGDMSRMSSHIMKNNSENVLTSAPFISIYITDISMAGNRRTYQQFTHSSYITEKKFDETTGQYSNEPGDRYEVIKHNPVPYDMSISVDIWTTNLEQKFQLFEQISALYNPHINLKTNSSPVDWSSLSYMEMVGNNFSGRSIPSGVDDVIDVLTFNFMIPIYINPPAKIRRERLIHTIISKLDVVDSENINYFKQKEDFASQFTSYTVITVENYKLQFDGNRVILLSKTGSNVNQDGTSVRWDELIKLYECDIRENVSQIRLRRTDDITDDSQDIIGTIAIDENDPQKLIFNVDTDTLPINTLGTIDSIIEPTQTYPGDGNLPTAQTGQKYLITYEIGENGLWGVTANQNDIIQFNGTEWELFFDSSESTGPETVYDTSTQDQYEWDGTVWKKSYEGIYNAGYWRLYL